MYVFTVRNCIFIYHGETIKDEEDERRQSQIKSTHIKYNSYFFSLNVNINTKGGEDFVSKRK